MIKEETRQRESTVFEGMISVRAVLESEHSDRKIEKILFSRAKEKNKARELAYLRARAKELSFPLEIVPEEDIDRLAVGNSHGGILALCSDRTYPKITKDAVTEAGFYVYMDGIEDPYNFGYALRSLYAAGADGVILAERNWLSAAGVVCRASAGASERMRLYAYDESFPELFRNAGYRIVSADTKNAVPMYEADLKKPLLLIVGGERRGIAKRYTDASDSIIRIEYGRAFRESLSAASAASVIAFEIYRQNR